IIVPADDRGIDKALHQVRFFLDQIAARLDQRRISGETLISEQKDLRLEYALLLNRERFRCHIALHRRSLVGKERLRIESVRLDLIIAEAVISLEPLEIGRDAFLGDK